MSENPVPRKRAATRALLGAGVFFALFVLALLAYNLTTSSRVSHYEATVERDAQTGIMTGFEPILLNTERKDRAVLLVHGFIGAPQNFGDLPHKIAEQGWRVEAMNLPGCGLTPHDHEATSFDALLAGVEERLRSLQSECETVVLIGHSQGGALSTLAAANLQPDGVVLVAPYFGLANKRGGDKLIEFAARLAAPVIRWLPEKGGSINLLENEQYIQRYAWVSTQACIAALETCAAVHDREAWKSITMPLLQIHSRNDRVTNPVASGAMFIRFPAEDKKLHWLTKSNHVYFWDYDAQEVSQEVLNFLKRWDPKPEAINAAS